LSNLGPIKHGEIELGDITLFVGKPNTGKSLAMRAIYQYLKERGIKDIVYLHQWTPIIALLNDNKYDEKIYNLLKPLLKGEIKYINGELVYVKDGKIIPWGHVSSSVMEILGFLLSVKEGSVILYEEPETHLHEELQLLMGIVLYALSSFNHVVISTHSQTIFYTIAHLSMLRPTKEELKDLFEDLKVKDYEALAEAVEKANQKEVKVKIYHFTEGEVKEVSVDEAVKGMPGTIDVLEKEFKWFSSLHSKRLFGET
jgi:predicted ATP-dependent endonuclease of OLD family